MKHPLVILHGWGLSAERFAPLVAELQKHHLNVFAPDFPGFSGNNIPDRPYTLADYTKFLHDYLHGKKIIHPVFVAHSFGGRVALKFQEMYPNETHALVLTGTPGFTPIPRKKLLLFITIAKIGGLFMSIPILRSAKDKVRAWYYYMVGARDFYRAEGVMRETFKNVVKEPLGRCMAKVAVPTMLVWGANDILVPSRVAKEMQKVIHGAQLIFIPNAGHEVPFTNPTAFVQKILPWVSSV